MLCVGAHLCFLLRDALAHVLRHSDAQLVAWIVAQGSAGLHDGTDLLHRAGQVSHAAGHAKPAP